MGPVVDGQLEPALTKLVALFWKTPASIPKKAYASLVGERKPTERLKVLIQAVLTPTLNAPPPWHAAWKVTPDALLP